MGQLALAYGADDMGSLMIEENVVAEAGTVHYLTLDQIRDAISEFGYTPRQRNVFYQLVDEQHEWQAIEANRRHYERICTANQGHSRMANGNGTSSSNCSSSVSPLSGLPVIPLSIASGDGTA
jgi:hypothetical protein